MGKGLEGLGGLRAFGCRVLGIFWILGCKVFFFFSGVFGF